MSLSRSHDTPPGGAGFAEFGIRGRLERLFGRRLVAAAGSTT